MKIDVDKLGDIFNNCKVNEDANYIQIPVKLFIEKYLENSSCSICTKRIIEDGVNHVRLYLKDDPKYRIMFVRSYLNRDLTFWSEAPLYLINDYLGINYVDDESEVIYLVEYFEKLYYSCSDQTYDLSEFMEYVFQVFKDDMEEASRIMYEDIEKCLIKEN